jgi:hypothetical protein
VVGSLLNESVLEETERFVNVRISETSDNLVYFDIRNTDGIPELDDACPVPGSCLA